MTDPPTAGPTQLTDRGAGVYLVSILSGSVCRFDLDACTVERLNGDNTTAEGQR